MGSYITLSTGGHESALIVDMALEPGEADRRFDGRLMGWLNKSPSCVVD